MPKRAVSSGAPNTRLKFGSRSLFKFSVKNCLLFGQLEVPVRFLCCENEDSSPGCTRRHQIRDLRQGSILGQYSAHVYRRRLPQCELRLHGHVFMFMCV
jgi:hypothetical protein